MLQTITRAPWTLALLMLIVACNPFEPTLSCSEYFSAGQRPGFELTGNGLALHQPSGTLWARCPAGMEFRGSRCQGTALYTNWDGAVAYASELSDKSGVAWRLPTNAEIDAITENACNNPTLNPQVFGGLDIENYWTSTRTLHNDLYRCTYYTYGGAVNCRQPKVADHPFLLLRADPLSTRR